ncbi:winged helix-turn-helix domain-containing protein [Pseudoxanthomonas japonensis]|uniref:winged helix-turn-helix domain-containing protein n=1 Tax=Pseudoxanthomonas japonensis TaxID=69284 RepID=UPI001BCE1276|nr:winged helix-turn-helix domain-containing protein [Pseudoxanthomonas japonensis]
MIPPDSTTLPAGDRLKVGECLVDIPLREIHAPEARRPARITPKSMGVLRVLVEHAGRVVTREALLAAVWPDTMPTNDVVTQAVTQLRKAFGERADGPRYIETIAKSGYRLLVDIEWLPHGDTEHGRAADAAPTVADAMPVETGVDDTEKVQDAPEVIADGVALPARHAVMVRRWAWGIGLGVIALVCAVAALWWSGAQRPRLTVQDEVTGLLPAPRPYRLITSAPGFELSPTLSPDGSQVAYLSSMTEELTGTAILVQTTEPAQPRTLTSPPDGAWDTNPEWSPNGREIAFLRRSPGEDCRIMAVQASGGEPRVLGICDPNNRPTFDWTPDGNGLVFSSPMSGDGEPGLRLLDLATGRWHAIDYGATAGDVDTAPRFSPDGKWIAFVRNTPLGDLWRIPSGGGTAERLTHQRAELRGWDWSPDGQAIVFGRRVDSHTRLYRLELASRSITDLGIEDAQAPVIAAQAGVLAFVQRKPQFGLYRIGEASAGGDARPLQRLFPSTGRDSLPSVAPDGRQIAFTSDRSGEFSLWWADMERPASLRPLEGIRPESRHLPAWSPDSKRLLVIGTNARGFYGLHELEPSSGQLVPLPVPVPREDLLFAAYLPDPAHLLVVAGRGDGQQLVLFDRRSTPWRRLASIDGVSFALPDLAQGRVLFTRLARDGLWQSDMALSADSIRQVDGSRPASQRYRTWTVTGDGQIDYLEQLPGCYVSLRHIGVGRSHPPARCLEPTHLATINGFSAHARDRVTYVSMAVVDGSDIGFLSLDPAPPSPGGGYW